MFYRVPFPKVVLQDIYIYIFFFKKLTFTKHSECQPGSFMCRTS